MSDDFNVSDTVSFKGRNAIVMKKLDNGNYVIYFADNGDAEVSGKDLKKVAE